MQKIDWSQVLKESIFIIGFAIIISLIYNTLNPYGINIMKKPQVVSDTLLERLLTDTSKITQTTKVDTTNAILTNDNVLQKNRKNDTLLAENPKVYSDNETKTNQNDVNQIEVPTITYQQLNRYLKSPNLILIDARSEEEYLKEHIGNAINIFAFEEDMNKYFQKLSKIPFDERKVIIVYCEGGACDASHKVATDLIRLGHKNVFVFSGGWEEWTKQKPSNNEQ
ncbi:MAG: rhodanese-like domain-containing protein [Candidatus Kapaibacteriota bacterium]